MENRGGQVDHHAVLRPQITGVDQRPLDARNALLDRGLGQPDQRGLGQRAGRNVDLHLDRQGVDSDQRKSAQLGQHLAGLFLKTGAGTSIARVLRHASHCHRRPRKKPAHCDGWKSAPQAIRPDRGEVVQPWAPAHGKTRPRIGKPQRGGVVAKRSKPSRLRVSHVAPPGLCVPCENPSVGFRPRLYACAASRLKRGGHDDRRTETLQTKAEPAATGFVGGGHGCEK